MVQDTTPQSAVASWSADVSTIQYRFTADDRRPVLELPDPQLDETEAQLYEDLRLDVWRSIDRYGDLWFDYPWPLLAIVDDPTAGWEDRILAFHELARRPTILIPIHQKDWDRAQRELIAIAELDGMTITAAYRESLAHAGALTIWRYPHLSGRELHEEIRREVKRYLNANKPSQAQRQLDGISLSRFEELEESGPDYEGDSAPSRTVDEWLLVDPRTIDDYLEEELQWERAQQYLRERDEAWSRWADFLSIHLSRKQIEALEKQRTTKERLTNSERQLVSRARRYLGQLAEENPSEFEQYQRYVDVTFWLPKSHYEWSRATEAFAA